MYLNYTTILNCQVFNALKCLSLGINNSNFRDSSQIQPFRCYNFSDKYFRREYDIINQTIF